jgi:hypothetical protein
VFVSSSDSRQSSRPFASAPPENNPVLVVDPNAALANPTPFQVLKSVAG